MHAAVLATGGSELGARTLEDVYYDTQHATLARRDCWLRARDGHWELKVPPGLTPGHESAIEARSGGERGVFEEIEGTMGEVDQCSSCSDASLDALAAVEHILDVRPLL